MFFKKRGGDRLMIQWGETMNMSRRSVLVVGGVVIFTAMVVYGGVRAQEASGSGEGGLDVTVRSDESMSGPQQVAWVEEQTRNVKQIYFQVQNMLDQARNEKDTLKITCLNDKLTQIHVNLRGVEERSEALKIAVQSGDSTASNQQFSILRIYISRIQGLKAEAENCLGEVDVVLGKTETTVEVSDDITVEDPSIIVDVDVIVEQPPHASGFY
jgi:hypothetical protein